MLIHPTDAKKKRKKETHRQTKSVKILVNTIVLVTYAILIRVWIYVVCFYYNL